LMRRPLLLAAERAIDARMPTLRADPDLREALRLYHRGEGVALPAPTSSAERDRQVSLQRNLAFHLTRTNVPPSGVLAQMREEAQATHQEMMEFIKDQPQAAAEMEQAIKGLLWNTGVLFAGGILRPWSMRALEECINDW